MLIEEVVRGPVTTIHVTASRLDAAVAGEFKSNVLDAIARRGTRIVLDLSEVQFLDSSGLGAIVHVHKNLGQNGPLEVVGANPPVRKVFDLTRMSSVFAMRDSEGVK